jgi:heme-degrading monooxygenase HmoA
LTVEGSERTRALLLVAMEPPDGFEDTLNRWYDEEHLAERLAMPGFLRARRFRSAEGSPRYLALYELADVDALTSPEYLRAKEHPTSLTQLVESRVRMRREVYVQIDERSAPSPQGTSEGGGV